MKTVAVTQRVDIFPNRCERRDSLDQRLIALLSKAGLAPTPVPNRLSANTSDPSLFRKTCGQWLAAIQPHCIVLSGGNDLGICKERDLTEQYLLMYAHQNRLPLLGICRGMQMMGVWAGAKLKPVAGHVQTRHKLTGTIAGTANSFHDFALTGRPTGFSIMACSDDGEIEAIRHDSLPWEGWMWHPEREKTFSPRDLRRLKELFDE